MSYSTAALNPNQPYATLPLIYRNKALQVPKNKTTLTGLPKKIATQETAPPSLANLAKPANDALVDRLGKSILDTFNDICYSQRPFMQRTRPKLFIITSLILASLTVGLVAKAAAGIFGK